jgi:hypothetical protein
VSRWLEAVRASGNSAPTLIICQRCHGNGYVLETTADSLTVQQCKDCGSTGEVLFSMYDTPDVPSHAIRTSADNSNLDLTIGEMLGISTDDVDRIPIDIVENIRNHLFDDDKATGKTYN